MGPRSPSPRRLTLLFSTLIPLALVTACGGADEPATLAIQTVAPRLEATFTPTVGLTATTAPPTATETRSTATATPPPTETPVPPTPTVAEGAVTITWIDFDPAVGRDADGEAVYIQNLTGEPVDMTGWTLTDIAEHLYVFPPFVLQPGATVTVHICAGEDNVEILFWGRCSAIWNNDGDTAYLHDTTGRLIASYSY